MYLYNIINLYIIYITHRVDGGGKLIVQQPQIDPGAARVLKRSPYMTRRYFTYL